jgi:membrane peptidoglycan carboxypeptidase
MGKYVRFGVLRGPFEHVVTEPDGSVVKFVTGPGAPGYVSYENISPWMTEVVTTTEDGRFFRHQGFSPFAIQESIVTNLDKGKFARGASTISQQLAKNLYLTRDKTISRKLQEVLITWQLELALTKEEILELYFNVIEFGPGIYGIKEAAQHYFGKHPADLTLLDCLFLASLIPNPKRYYHQFSRGKVTENWSKKLRFFASAMVDRGKITQAQFDGITEFSPYFRTSVGPRGGDLAPDGEFLDNLTGLEGRVRKTTADDYSDEELEDRDSLGIDPENAP